MFDQDKEDFLEHYGVKGMRWGQTGRSAQIKNARKRQGTRQREVLKADDAVTIAARKKDPKALAAANKKLEKVSKEFDDSPDRPISMKMTMGEAAVSVFLLGPIGLVPVAGMEVASNIVGDRQDKRAAGKK